MFGTTTSFGNQKPLATARRKKDENAKHHKTKSRGNKSRGIAKGMPLIGGTTPIVINNAASATPTIKTAAVKKKPLLYLKLRRTN